MSLVHKVKKISDGAHCVALKALGNAVVPQQGLAALRVLGDDWLPRCVSAPLIERGLSTAAPERGW